MSASPRTFVTYQRPSRSRRTLREMVGTFLVAFVGLGITVAQLPGLDARGMPTAGFFVGCVTLLVGLVALIIGKVLLWSFAVGKVHEVRVTDRGVFYDGKEWSWGSVRRIRVWPPTANGGITVFVSVNRDGLRSALSLPIEISAPEPQKVIAELEDYLNSTEYSNSIRWEHRVT
jgi:hypothetical protein